MRPVPEPPGPGQESVWTYPRPAIAQASDRHVQIVHRGVTLADTRAAVRTLETSHPPSWYIPRADIAQGVLIPSPRRSICEWKGQAVYFHVQAGADRFEDVAWSYPDPTPAFRLLAGHVAFYAWPFDTCLIDGEPVAPQPGRFYGGWITRDLAGPFKGGPGTMGW